MSEEQLYEEMSRDLDEIEQERIKQIRQEAAKECVAMILQGSSFSSKKDFVQKIKSHFELD